MDTTKKGMLYLICVLCAVGTVRSQTEDVHAVCSPDVWTLNKSVTLQCFLKNSSYPSKCVSSDGNKAIFRQSNDGVSFTNKCTVTDIRGACTSTGGCRCSGRDATHYIFSYTFTVTEDSEGYWDCNVPCFNGPIPLTSSNQDCDNKKVIKDQSEELEQTEKDLNQTKDHLRDAREDVSKTEKQRNVVGIAFGCFVIGCLCLVIVICFVIEKPRALVLTEPHTTPEDLSTTALIIMQNIGGVQITIIPTLNHRNGIYVLIRSRNLIKLIQAEKKMKSAFPALRQPMHQHEPAADYPRDSPSLGNSFRSMRPNGSSEHATNGRTNVTPL